MKKSDETRSIKERFGLDLAEIVNRHRGHCILLDGDLDEQEREAGIESGYLRIKARDGASNPPSSRAYQHRGFVFTCEDEYDPTYRYYYFRPLEESRTLTPELEAKLKAFVRQSLDHKAAYNTGIKDEETMNFTPELREWLGDE